MSSEFSNLHFIRILNYLNSSGIFALWGFGVLGHFCKMCVYIFDQKGLGTRQVLVVLPSPMEVGRSQVSAVLPSPKEVGRRQVPVVLPSPKEVDRRQVLVVLPSPKEVGRRQVPAVLP